MNRDNEEQRPVSQTICRALQKEANCKCLVLSFLIYGCLAAVTWCRCANVTKIVINFSKYPLKSTRHVSPCDDGYIYIPVAFMGMLYLVYLVECYHSPIRIDLLHSASQDNILAKLSQLKLAQPTIWWKALSYHYVRRKRQITRYRNGGNYTFTQVYYERVNTHAATSVYFYEYCGVKDISKNLIINPKIPITKITLSKGFAFSNMRSATEFEEARSRFFAEQELRDDYMEMREGLDIGYNFNGSTTFVAVLGKPWFTNSYIYWCLSALLLSWPLRIIIECNTQYVDYQITKLFGINYDTPTSTHNIHASSSQLSAPGSYMLAPSYSEALLMEPTGPIVNNCDNEMLVPSYSEALLYERAVNNHSNSNNDDVQVDNDINTLNNESEIDNSSTCNCLCHQNKQNVNVNVNSNNLRGQSSPDIRMCDVCSTNNRPNYLKLVRDVSEPNFNRRFDRNNLIKVNSLQFLLMNGRSLENILENDEPSGTQEVVHNNGAIPKRTSQYYRNVAHSSKQSDTFCKSTRIPSSQTNFSLKSILKQNKRRYSLITTDELKNLGDKHDSMVFLQESSSKVSKRQSPKESTSRTLIFASPIHQVCRPNDPFLVQQNEMADENLLTDVSLLTKLGHSLNVLTDCDSASNVSIKRRSKCFKHHPTLSIEPEYLQFISTPSCSSSDINNSNNSNQISTTSQYFINKNKSNGLKRSLTEKRSKPYSQINKRLLRRSFTDERTDFGKKMNLNMETSL